MKSAKEMFEELGFKLEEVTDTYIAYGFRGSSEDCFVCFELKDKYVNCFYNDHNANCSQPLEVEYVLYKAISKQVEELWGWNK